MNERSYNFTRAFAFGLLVLLLSQSSLAAVDKVYHPYVEGYIKEVEYRTTVSNDSSADLDGLQAHKLALGYGFTDRFFLEGYFVGEKSSGESLELEAYELEALFQLTEQGEYWSDWGLLIELEREKDANIYELGVGLLWEKEANQWIAVVNIIPVYEFGEDVDDELELEGAAQLKFRHKRELEPALEFYWDENMRSAGPVLMGTQGRGMSKWKWELGLMLGLNSKTPDQTLRALVEFEF